MNVGESKDFAYQGSVESWVVPNGGWYLLEAWGAQGGRYGGKGGYAKGCAKLKKGQTLYCAVGGQGTTSNSGGATISGGFNGGGKGVNPNNYGFSGSGGGATHLALADGLLHEIGYEEFVTNRKGLIIAGGGGGGAYHDFKSPATTGGSGGGLVGGNGTRSGDDRNYAIGQGGTQTSGYAFGAGENGVWWNDGGQSTGGAGAGGGLYGGTKGNTGSGWWVITSAGGGSSFIDNLEPYDIYFPSTTAGQNGGNGKAKITFLAKGFPEIKIGDITIDGINIGDIEIEGIAVGDAILE